MRKVMGLVSTNYYSSEFGALTRERPIAALPYGGRYRLVDFPLSNMINSGINIVGLITPYMYRSLIDHLGSGNGWMLNRKVGGMFILPGSVYGYKSVRGKFILRDLIQNRLYFERGDRELVMFSASSKVMNIDFADVVKQHEDSGADITLVCKPGYAPEHGEERYIRRSPGGRVTELTTSPDAFSACFLDAFIIDRSLLLRFADWYQALGYIDLIDIIAENLDKVNVRCYEFGGYVGAVNDISGYMQVNRDFLDERVQHELFLEERPIKTKILDAAPAKYEADSHVSNSIVSTGCRIAGTVEDSLIFRGATIERGATVKNCIIMQKTVIGAGAHLENVICDKLARIKPGVQVCGSEDAPIIVEKFSDV